MSDFEERDPGDGRYLAFASSASNLVANDFGFTSDCFVRDLQTGQTTCLSLTPTGALPNSESLHPLLSAGGGYAAFLSFASNLVTGDANGVCDVFVVAR